MSEAGRPPSSLSELLDLAVAEVVDHSSGIAACHITPRVSAGEIREHLSGRYGAFEEPQAAEELVADVSRMMREWNLHVTHPRYFGLFNPSVHAEAVAADALVAGYNPQMAAWSHAPAACEIERHTLRFFATRLGYDPATSAAHFTSGGAEANLSGVLVALTDRLPDYSRQGLHGVERWPLIYLSSESHHSFEKVAHMVGLGRDAVRLIPVTPDLRMDVAALEERIAADRADGFEPLVVVATAGTTGAGIVDPLPEMADLCARERLWLHVDAAWGGAARLSPKLAPVLAGIERADSITWDAHKWLSVPMGAGMFFCAHAAAVRRAFGSETPYMPTRVEDTEDPYQTTVQWSRRHIGLKVFMTLAGLGEKGLVAAIEHQAAMGRRLASELCDAGWTVVNETPLPVVCFTHRRLQDGVLTTDDLVRAVLAENLWISEVRLGGAEPVLRACITSFLTQASDVVALVETATRLVAGSGESSGR